MRCRAMLVEDKSKIVKGIKDDNRLKRTMSGSWVWSVAVYSLRP